MLAKHDGDIIGPITEIEDLFIFVEAVPRAEGCRRDSEPPHAKAPMGVVPVPEEHGRHLFHRNLRRVLKRRVDARHHRTHNKGGSYASYDSLHRLVRLELTMVLMLCLGASFRCKGHLYIH